MTALNGRDDNVDFQAYLSKAKLIKLGIVDKSEQRVVKNSLQRISELGNSTKHHMHSAGFHSVQLANDFHVLQDLIVSLIKEIIEIREES